MDYCIREIKKRKIRIETQNKEFSILNKETKELLLSNQLIQKFKVLVEGLNRIYILTLPLTQESIFGSKSGTRAPIFRA